MAEHADEILIAICEIRDLVRLLAEPAIAARDEKARNELRRIVGNSAAKAKAVVLMDGSRTQRAIHRETGINEGQLSTLVKQLNAGKLLRGNGKEPTLTLSIPANFFETGASDE
jgi:hypothetical protein